MLKLDVKVDLHRLRREMQGFEKDVNKAAAVALNRVATTVRKEANQDIRKSLNLSASVVRANLNVVRPYGNRLIIRDVVASGDPVPLRDYQARMTRKGATFKVKKGAGRK